MLEHLRPDPDLASRTVVMGAAGFVGGAICERLETAGAALERISSQEIDLLSPEAETKLRSRLASGDALVLVSALAPCRDVSTLMKNLRMVEAASAAIADLELDQLVYISSDAVYADHCELVQEDSCVDPSSLHGMMHRVRELVLGTSVSAPIAILRPSLLYGSRDPHNGYGPNRFRRLAARGETIGLFGEGEEQRDHVFVGDVAELVRLALLHRSRGVLNVATGRSVSFREVAEHVVALFPRPVEIVGTPRKNPITHRHFDVTATHKAFPQFQYTPLEEGLRKVHQEASGSGEE